MDLCAIPEPGEPKNLEVTLPECHIRKVSSPSNERDEPMLTSDIMTGCRHHLRGEVPLVEDLEKARWYLDREIERVKRQ